MNEEKVINEEELVEEKTGVWTKVKGGFKNHRKAIALAGIVGLIGYAVGSKKKPNGDSESQDLLVTFDDVTEE